MKKHQIAASFIACLVMMLLTGCGVGLLDMLKHDNPTLDKKTFQLNSSTLEIGTPFELENINLDQGEFDKYIVKSVYKAGHDNEVMVKIEGISIDVAKLEADIHEPFIYDLDEAIKAAVDGLGGNNIWDRKMGSVKNIEINGVKGREVSGTLRQGKQGDSKSATGSYRICVFFKGTDAWYVAIVWDNKDKHNEEKIAAGIYNSIKIK